MEFSEKYISVTQNAEKPDPTKIEISNDAYAIGEEIDKLISKIEQTRLALT